MVIFHSYVTVYQRVPIFTHQIWATTWQMLVNQTRTLAIIGDMASRGAPEKDIHHGYYPKLTKRGTTIVGVPSGKLSHNYGKSPCLMGKSIINGHFQ